MSSDTACGFILLYITWQLWHNVNIQCCEKTPPHPILIDFFCWCVYPKLKYLSFQIVELFTHAFIEHSANKAWGSCRCAVAEVRRAFVLFWVSSGCHLVTLPWMPHTVHQVVAREKLPLFSWVALPWMFYWDLLLIPGWVVAMLLD